MTPLQRYQEDLKQDDFFYDAAQAKAVNLLEDLYQRLVNKPQPEKKTLLKRFKTRFNPQPVEPEQGLYLWGGVGRGKTYLVDVFYHSLPFENKLRVHFHRFMQRVHSELSQVAGKSNPIQLVAERLADEAQIVCFDEFFVSDITDAMILAELTKGLFERGVCLVATSNIPPKNLYENGLQRVHFLPTIDLIERYTAVHEIDGGVDHRLRLLEQANLYYTPLGADAEQALHAFFKRLMAEGVSLHEKVAVSVLGRTLFARYEAGDVVWFDFAQLCDGPRSQNDYIELAKEYHAVVLSDVPQLEQRIDDQARRFISLVDEFYDHNVKLIISAAVPLLELYAGGTLEFEFQRTMSRLQEMQSSEYLERAHRA